MSRLNKQIDFGYRAIQIPKTRIFGLFVPYEKLKKAGEMYVGGASQNKIIKELHIAATTLRDFLIRSGLKEARVKDRSKPQEWQFKPQGNGSTR